MAQGQIRLLTVLVALLAMAGAVWLWGEGTDPDSNAWDPAATVPIWDFSLEDIAEVEAVLGEQRVVLRAVGDVFRIAEPVEMDANPYAAKAFMDDLADLKLGIQVPRGEPSDFGLEEGTRGVARVTLADGRVETLWIGASAPIGWRTYVQRPGGAMAVVPGRLRDTVLVQPLELRDRALVRFELEQAKSAKIVSSAGTLDVFLDEGRWWVRGYGRADLDRVDELFVGLSNLRLDGWDEGALNGPIVDPLFDVTVELKNGTQKGFQVGPNLPNGRLIRTHLGMTGHIRNEVLAMLNQGPNHVGDPDGFPISESETQEISGSIGSATFHITDDGSGWRAIKGESSERLLDALSLVQAHYRKKPVPQAQPPLSEVHIKDKGGAIRTVEVGSALVDGKWYVAVEGPHQYRYLIDSAGWDEVRRAVAAPAK